MKRKHLPILPDLPKYPDVPAGTYNRIYQVLGDGRMEGCLGAACPNSCCNVKAINGGDGRYYHYRASLFDDAEAEYQSQLEEADPKLAALGVTIVRKKIDGRLHYLVSGCLDEGKGCKLEPIARKPLSCQTFPVGIPYESDEPDLKSCPAREDILNRNFGRLKPKIAEVDELLEISKTRAARKIILRETARRLTKEGYTPREGKKIIEAHLKRQR